MMEFAVISSHFTPLLVFSSHRLSVVSLQAVTIKSMEYAIIDKAWKEGWVVAQPPKSRSGKKVRTLHVEYAEREKEYGILFIFSLFCEYIHLEYVRIHVIYWVTQAEYVIHFLVVASQEYVNIYSTRRVRTLRGQSRMRYSLPPPGFSESTIHLASATGQPLGFLWIHVQGFIRWATKNPDPGLCSSLRGLPT